MLGKLHLLLATACVVALVAEGHPDCAYAEWGAKDKGATAVGPLVIEAKKREVNVKIPFMHLLGCDVVGVSAFTCDSGDDTRLSFVEEFTVHVSRRRAFWAATLYAIVYCKQLWHPTTNSPNRWQQVSESIIPIPHRGGWTK